MESVFSVSVDLDSIDCYYRIHGLGPAPSGLRQVILRRCLPRFLELFQSLGVRATLFVVASDVDEEQAGGEVEAARELLESASSAGHELGNHSWRHPYDLARRSRAEAAEEIGRAHEILSALGAAPRGFRAPGYDLSPAMLAELDRLGYLYDSSLFPAPGYYAAKLAVLGAMRVAGRKSGAVITHPLALLASTQPYRPSRRSPWRRGQSRVVELPIAVTPRLRLPAIGTSLLLAPAPVRRWLLGGATRARFFNFELHGIDLADADADGLPDELVARQPDLRLSAVDKTERLSSMLAALLEQRASATLAEVATELQPRL